MTEGFNLLEGTVFINLEVIFIELLDEIIVAVSHRHLQQNDVHTRFDFKLIWLDGIVLGKLLRPGSS